MFLLGYQVRVLWMPRYQSACALLCIQIRQTLPLVFNLKTSCSKTCRNLTNEWRFNCFKSKMGEELSKVKLYIYIRKIERVSQWFESVYSVQDRPNIEWSYIQTFLSNASTMDIISACVIGVVEAFWVGWTRCSGCQGNRAAYGIIYQRTSSCLT